MVGPHRTAGTIVAIEKNIITFQADKATRTDGLGMSDAQSYDYERNEQGAKYYFKIVAGGLVAVHKNVVTGRWNKGGSGNLTVGVRRAYYDFSF